MASIRGTRADRAEFVIGVDLRNSTGNAWTADYLKITGELDVDLAEQHRCRGARKNRLRAADRLLRRSRHQRRAPIFNDARDHTYEGLYGGARQHG